MRDYAMVLSSFKQDTLHLQRPGSLNCPDPIGTASAEGWTAQELAVALQFRALTKKYAPKGQSPAAIKATFEKFRRVNDKVGFRPPNELDCESTVYMLNIFRDELWKLLDFEVDGRNFDLAYMADHFAVGPGASRLADSRNFYTKLWDSDHSYTNPFVLALFRAAVSGSSTWTSALEAWAKMYRPVLVEGNSLFTVKKNSEISRTCCTEALINMMCQKALGSFTEDRLARWGIRLDLQPDVNREMARLGSIDGAFGTTDLSDASDSISLALCDWSLPPTFNKWLRAFRSETTVFPDGSQVRLNMVSTMGNGFTFPLETAIFASAVRAVYKAKGIEPNFVGPQRNCAVFGDDIVVRKDCFETTNRLLVRLGFTVNDGKSFNTGSFRESCGFDYWGGRNIRPVYVESVQTPQDVYSTFNRLSRWSAENLVPLGRTLLLLSKWARYLPIPFSEGDDSGFKVPERIAPYRLDQFGWRRYSFIRPISMVERVPKSLEEAVSHPPNRRPRYRGFNAAGWELAFLGQYARNPLGTFKTSFDEPEQLNERKFDGICRRPYQGEVLPRERRTRSIPHWDWFGHEDRGRFGLESFQAWKSLVAVVFQD